MRRVSSSQHSSRLSVDSNFSEPRLASAQSVSTTIEEWQKHSKASASSEGLSMTRSSMMRMRLSTSNTSASSYNDAKKREYHSVEISSVSAKETSTSEDSTSHKMVTRSVPKSPKQSQSFRRSQVARISVHF